MKKTTTLCILIASLLGLCNTTTAQDLSLYEKREYKATDQFTLPYRILFPEGFKPTKKYPLVVFLHGAGERGTDNEAQLTHGARQFVSSANRKAYQAIVIFPQCPKDRVWFNHPYLTQLLNGKKMDDPIELKAVKAVIDELTSTGYVDTRRIYLTGISMGGFGTFGALAMWPTLFAAAAPICGGAQTETINRYAHVPLWIFHGGADNVVKPELSRQAVETLKAAGAKVKYTEYEGVGHNSWDNAFAEPKYLKWMFAQKKKNTPEE